MRSPYEDFSAIPDSGEEAKSRNTYYNNKNNCAIPYHARENSLPFSYGQINKTSTPLRSTTGGTSGLYRDHDRDIDESAVEFGLHSITAGTLKKDANFNYSSDPYYVDDYSNKRYNSNNNGLTATLKSTTKASTVGSVTDTTNPIKAQPRLTSPILVRKTLNSRSPTRYGSGNSNDNSNSNTNTNTIANTYHYKYGSGCDSGFDNTAGAGRALNGNISSNSYGINNNYGTNKYNHGNNNSNRYNSNNNFIVGDTIDGVGLGNVLRKTQPRDDFEELLRERREKVLREHYLSTGSAPLSNGSDNIGGSGSGSGSNAQSNQRKFNYDFEFHLNLDEAPPPPRRAHTMDRSSLQQLQQYRTRDIPMARETASSTYNVERNYHTISSSNASRETSNTYTLSQQQQQQQQRPPFESIYSTVERRTVQALQQPQPQRSPQLQLQQQRPPDHITTYGNENSSGYGLNEYGNNRSSLGAAVVARSRNDLSSPIYATTTKQVATSNLATYRNKRSNNAIEPELSTTDHPMPLSLSVASANSNNVLAAGKISPSSSQLARPETPAFPVTSRTPYGAYNGQNNSMGYPHSPVMQRRDLENGKSMIDLQNYSSETVYRTSGRPRLDSNMSLVNSEPQEVAAHLVKFAKDSSKYWYKPNLTRDEVVQLLVHAEPGTFIVRNSTTYKDNYGLVVRVHQPPPNSELTGQPDDLVRHFLIEPTKHGVRLKSCANEPVFTSLSALIYEHSINKLALPCLLRIPDHDLLPSRIEPTSAQKQLLTQGAACNVLWLFSCETESLTGEEAIRKAIRQLYAHQPMPIPTEVHFKVTQHGITLTDNTRKKFFRKHYAADTISYCAIDPDHRLWSLQSQGEESGKNTVVVGALKKTIFAFVARHSPKSKDNQCHVFCDLDVHQPASAIVSFANKTLPTEKERSFVL